VDVSVVAASTADRVTRRTRGGWPAPAAADDDGRKPAAVRLLRAPGERPEKGSEGCGCVDGREGLL
jgi:hypothetical protein